LSPQAPAQGEDYCSRCSTSTPARTARRARNWPQLGNRPVHRQHSVRRKDRRNCPPSRSVKVTRRPAGVNASALHWDLIIDTRNKRNGSRADADRDAKTDRGWLVDSRKSQQIGDAKCDSRLTSRNGPANASSGALLDRGPGRAGGFARNKRIQPTRRSRPRAALRDRLDVLHRGPETRDQQFDQARSKIVSLLPILSTVNEHGAQGSTRPYPRSRSAKGPKTRSWFNATKVTIQGKGIR